MVKKENKQDLIIGELESMDAKLKLNNTLLDIINKTLENKTLEVNKSKSLSSLIFISLYFLCFFFIAIGIIVEFNFNAYATYGSLGLILVSFIAITYYSNI